MVYKLNKFITKETGLLAISRGYDDCIELTQEEALSLARFINKNKKSIAKEEEF